jgi:hypothetical protein
MSEVLSDFQFDGTSAFYDGFGGLTEDPGWADACAAALGGGVVTPAQAIDACVFGGAGDALDSVDIDAIIRNPPRLISFVQTINALPYEAVRPRVGDDRRVLAATLKVGDVLSHTALISALDSCASPPSPAGATLGQCSALRLRIEPKPSAAHSPQVFAQPRLFVPETSMHSVMKLLSDGGPRSGADAAVHVVGAIARSGNEFGEGFVEVASPAILDFARLSIAPPAGESGAILGVALFVLGFATRGVAPAPPEAPAVVDGGGASALAARLLGRVSAEREALLAKAPRESTFRAPSIELLYLFDCHEAGVTAVHRADLAGATAVVACRSRAAMAALAGVGSDHPAIASYLVPCSRGFILDRVVDLGVEYAVVATRVGPWPSDHLAAWRIDGAYLHETHGYGRRAVDLERWSAFERLASLLAIEPSPRRSAHVAAALARLAAPTARAAVETMVSAQLGVGPRPGPRASPQLLALLAEAAACGRAHMLGDARSSKAAVSARCRFTHSVVALLATPSLADHALYSTTALAGAGAAAARLFSSALLEFGTGSFVGADSRQLSVRTIDGTTWLRAWLQHAARHSRPEDVVAAAEQGALDAARPLRVCALLASAVSEYDSATDPVSSALRVRCTRAPLSDPFGYRPVLTEAEARAHVRSSFASSEFDEVLSARALEPFCAPCTPHVPAFFSGRAARDPLGDSQDALSDCSDVRALFAQCAEARWQTALDAETAALVRDALETRAMVAPGFPLDAAATGGWLVLADLAAFAACCEPPETDPFSRMPVMVYAASKVFSSRMLCAYSNALTETRAKLYYGGETGAGSYEAALAPSRRRREAAGEAGVVDSFHVPELEFSRGVSPLCKDLLIGLLHYLREHRFM